MQSEQPNPDNLHTLSVPSILAPRPMTVSSASSTSNKSHKSQKYKNIYAFHHNKSSKKTKLILSFPINGLCGKCVRLIEWRKRYRKYKPLTVPRRCVKCGEKHVKEAYHEACHPCAAASVICAKCLLPWSGEDLEDVNEGDRAEEVQKFCRDLNARLLLEADEREEGEGDCVSDGEEDCVSDGEEIDQEDEEEIDSECTDSECLDSECTEESDHSA